MQEIIDYVLKNVISIALGGGTLNYIIAGVVLVLGVAGIILFKKSAAGLIERTEFPVFNTQNSEHVN